MRNATRTVSAAFGITTGISGAGHGVYEILQGNWKPDGIVISSIGPPCVPDAAWNSCEPAMTIIQNFMITGIIAVVIGVLILIWSIWFNRQGYFGSGLILLSVVLLLFGGGFFPPLIGLVGGVAGLSIYKQIKEKAPGLLIKIGSMIWPWPLVIFLVWVFGQLLVGALFNDLMKSIMGFGVILILVMLPLSVFSAYSRDIITKNSKLERL